MVRETTRIVFPALKDPSITGPYISSACQDKPMYRLEKVSECTCVCLLSCQILPLLYLPLTFRWGKVKKSVRSHSLPCLYKPAVFPDRNQIGCIFQSYLLPAKRVMKNDCIIWLPSKAQLWVERSGKPASLSCRLPLAFLTFGEFSKCNELCLVYSQHSSLDGISHYHRRAIIGEK